MWLKQNNNELGNIMLKKSIGCSVFHVFQRDRAVHNLKFILENKTQGLALSLVALESLGTLTSLTMSIHYH